MDDCLSEIVDISPEDKDFSPEEVIDFSPEEETDFSPESEVDTSPEAKVVGSPVKGSWLVDIVRGFGPLFCSKLSRSVFSSLKNFSLSTRRG